MTDLNDFPELVRHLRLDANFRHKRTVHRLRSTRQGSKRKETWVREKKIGHGGYGQVWLERRAENCGKPAELRAVKCIHASLQRREYGRELEALATFSSNKFKYNDFFVQFHGWFESTEWLHVVMEYCEHGDLRNYIGSHGRIPEADTQDITRQLLVGLSLMHEAGFAHRDIKPANILVKSAPPAHWWVKLGDLGLSKRAEAVSGSSTVRATPGFVPPELYGLTREDPKHIDPFYSDVWCLAETVYRILTDRETFDSFVKLSDYVGHRMPFPEEALLEADTSEPGIAFIKSLMAPLPVERMSAEQALKHPWIVLDEGAKSDSEDTASVQSDSTVASVSSDWDEDVTQPATNWTSDVETAGLEDLAKLSIEVAEADGHTARHEEQSMPCSSTSTVRMARRSKYQAYVEDPSEDSTIDGGTGTITHNQLAGVKSPGATKDADQNGSWKTFSERGVEKKETARTHATGDFPLSSSAGPAPSAPYFQHPLNKLPDPTHKLSASPIDPDSPARPADQEQCNPGSSGERRMPQRQPESTNDLGPVHTAPTGTKAQQPPRAKSLQKGRKKTVRFASHLEGDSKQHIISEEARSFISVVQNSDESHRFRSMPATLLSEHLLDKILGFRSNVPALGDDPVEFAGALNKKQLLNVIRLNAKYRAGFDPWDIYEFHSETDSDSDSGLDSDSSGDASDRPRSPLKLDEGPLARLVALSDPAPTSKLTEEAVGQFDVPNDFLSTYSPRMQRPTKVKAECGDW